MHVVYINILYIGIVHSDIQEVCRSSRTVIDLVLEFIGAKWDVFAPLTSYLMIKLEIF